MRAVGTVTDDFPIWTQRRHTMRATFSRFAWFKRTRSTLRPTTTIPPFSVDRILQQIVLAKVFIVDSPLLIVLLDLRMVS